MCIELTFNDNVLFGCMNKLKECTSNGGACVTTVDAYYYISAIFLVIGAVWLAVFYRIIRRMSRMSQEEWKVNHVD
jgi:hypothetical protein